jgi:hypothetical protein
MLAILPAAWGLFPLVSASAMAVSSLSIVEIQK